MAEIAIGEPTTRTAERTLGPRQNRVLAGLPPRELALLTRHLRTVHLKPGAVLQRQDRPLEYIYFPHEGLVSLFATTPTGETVEAASVGCAGAVCPLLKPNERKAFLTAIAQGAMLISRIMADQLQTAERQSEALSHAMYACREALLLQLRENIACVGIHSVEQRMSRWLLETADSLEMKTGPIPITQRHVAQRLGVQRTTINLVAGKLEEARAIRWTRSRVEIVDRAKLELMACGCSAAQRKRTGTLLPADEGELRK